MSLSFEALTATAHGHFQLHRHAAALRILEAVRALSPPVPPERIAFLEDYRRAVDDLDAHALERELVLWEATGPRDLPLRLLGEQSGLGLTQRLMLVAVGLGEEDSRFGALFAGFQGGRSRRPSIESLARLVARPEDGDGWAQLQPLIDQRLVEVEDPSAPRAEQALRVPGLLWDVLRGRGAEALPAWLSHTTLDEARPLGAWVLAPDVEDRLRRLAQLFERGEASALLLRGSPGGESAQIAASVAGSLERGLLGFDGRIVLGADPRARLVGPLAALLGAMPAARFDLNPGETVELSALEGYAGPIAVLLGREGGVRGPAVGRAVTVSVPPPLRVQRARLWSEAFEGAPVVELDEIVRAIHLPAGYIRQAAELAKVDARIEADGAVRPAHVRRACRFLNRQLLDALATRVEVDGGWERLVVGASAEAKLHELERRCRHREQLLDHLGPAFAHNSTRGVRGLFAGASGTGKTLAARVLASVLGMDLYRVDLAAVVNKYIGETEKNLHRVLSVAEELDVVLLLDEGDSLLAGRTEVRSSNDRYANLETNYLLQRLETYDGIVLVTTNVGDGIDQAFRRRMDVIVDFVKPGAAERRAIWGLHLPVDNDVPGEVLDTLAGRCALSGGQIRNAAQHAALLALDSGVPRVGRAHLEEALRSEYRKAGATWPLEARTRERDDRVTRFVEGFGR